MSELHARKTQHAELTHSLILRLRQGDEKAGVLLDALYRAPLLRFCEGYIHSREGAEDVVQEVFVRVLTSDTVPDFFRAWLYQIARNRCLDLLRSSRRRPEPEELPTESHLPVEMTGNLTRLVGKEQQEHLLNALNAIPIHQQEVLRLRYAEDLSRAEIARILDLTEPVVKSRIFEGLEALRRQASSFDRKS
jgi:RNA polymerase sigma-70 factor, ECF subfamily